VRQAALAPAEAHRLALLDESFQEARWGVDEAAAARRARAAREVALAARLLALAPSARAP
jgi:chaperone required for assembly of F1-ATPase